MEVTLTHHNSAAGRLLSTSCLNEHQIPITAAAIVFAWPCEIGPFMGMKQPNMQNWNCTHSLNWQRLQCELMTPEWPTTEHFNISIHSCQLSADNGNDGELGRCQAVDLWPAGELNCAEDAGLRSGLHHLHENHASVVLLLNFSDTQQIHNRV